MAHDELTLSSRVGTAAAAAAADDDDDYRPGRSGGSGDCRCRQCFIFVLTTFSVAAVV